MIIRQTMPIFGIFVWVIFAAIHAVGAAEVNEGSGIEQSGEDGAVYRVTFFGDLVLGPDRTLSGAMMKGKGQHIVKENTLVTSEEIVSITNKDLKLQIEEKIITFSINPNTKVCDDDQLTKTHGFIVGDIVTVVSEKDKNIALSIRSGPMFFSGMMSLGLTLEDYDC